MADKDTPVLHEAIALAQTGRYRDWRGIQAALIFDHGMTDADKRLESEVIRQELDRICIESRKPAAKADCHER